MQKRLIPLVLSSLLIPIARPILNDWLTELPQEVHAASHEDHDHEGHDHDHHDHEGHDHDHHEDHEGHDHAFDFDPEQVVKKESDQFIMAHGDHFHKVPLSDLSEEQIQAAEDHLAAHPELAKNYDKDLQIAEGYFQDEDVLDRDLSDWAGEWQSVYPYLQDGTLDPVMAQKAAAKDSDKTQEEYKDYYTKGYQTDIDQVIITEDSITFKRNGQTTKATYVYSGYKILDYEKGNRGVRYLFTKSQGDDQAPTSIQFSDHHITPSKDLTHFHLFFSDEDQEKLLEEMDNWPTFYPADWGPGQILADQLNH